MSFFADYGLFLAKTATIIISILVILAAIMAAKSKAKAEKKGSLHIKRINEKYEDMAALISEATQEKSVIKQLKKEDKKQKKSAQKKRKNNPQKRLFVLHFEGDIKASAVDALREEITAILLIATPDDEVLLCLESPGGIVNGYGLAASQLQRLRDANVYLTVSVDKIAASGGYMMACVANQIIAAPFSIIGSIGVVAQLPNFHRFLQKKNIDFEQITAGEYKRTLTLFGENTNIGREKMQQEVDEIHTLFKSFVKSHRKNVIIEEVATGEHWFAAQTLQKQLVDKLQTSDDFLLIKKEEYALYEIRYKIKQPITKRLAMQAQNAFYQLTKNHEYEH